MSGSPNYKIYNAQNEYVASVKDPVHGLILVDFIGRGSTIRWGHPKKNAVWHEGFEDRSAVESYDHNCDVIRTRCDAIFEAQERSLAELKGRYKSD